jgi:hypothetical protein
MNGKERRKVGGKREQLCDARRVAHLAKGGASAVSDD